MKLRLQGVQYVCELRHITRMNGFYFLARPALALQSALRPQAPQSASLKFVMKYIKNKSYDN